MIFWSCISFLVCPLTVIVIQYYVENYPVTVLREKDGVSALGCNKGKHWIAGNASPQNNMSSNKLNVNQACIYDHSTAGCDKIVSQSENQMLSLPKRTRQLPGSADINHVIPATDSPAQWLFTEVLTHSSSTQGFTGGSVSTSQAGGSRPLEGPVRINKIL